MATKSLQSALPSISPGRTYHVRDMGLTLEICRDLIHDARDRGHMSQKGFHLSSEVTHSAYIEYLIGEGSTDGASVSIVRLEPRSEAHQNLVGNIVAKTWGDGAHRDDDCYNFVLEVYSHLKIRQAVPDAAPRLIGTLMFGESIKVLALETFDCIFMNTLTPALLPENLRYDILKAVIKADRAVRCQANIVPQDLRPENVLVQVHDIQTPYSADALRNTESVQASTYNKVVTKDGTYWVEAKLVAFWNHERINPHKPEQAPLSVHRWWCWDMRNLNVYHFTDWLRDFDEQSWPSWLLKEFSDES